MKYNLADCQKQHEETPLTFGVPTEKELIDIQVGDYVKLIFEEENQTPERMWVEVTFANFPYFSGELNNVPYQLRSVALGDKINFYEFHVANILK